MTRLISNPVSIPLSSPARLRTVLIKAGISKTMKAPPIVIDGPSIGIYAPPRIIDTPPMVIDMTGFGMKTTVLTIF